MTQQSSKQPDKEPCANVWLRRAIVVLVVMCAVSTYTNWRTLNVIKEMATGKCTIGEIKE